MTKSLQPDIAALAARLVVEEDLDYAHAKRKATRALGGHASRALPSNEEVEDAVREELALFHAHTQPQELALLRGLATRWMQRLSDFNPHLAGAVWRGTATARSRVCIELYAQDAKLAEMALINLGVHEHAPGSGGDGCTTTLMQHARVAGLDGPVMVEFQVLDADELRGALKPDARGRTWRGNLAALEALRKLDDAAVVDGSSGRDVGTRS